MTVSGADELLVTKDGGVIRILAGEVRVQGRSTQGVRIMNVKVADEVAVPCPLDLWLRSSRPGECSSFGPSARDIRCCMKGPPKRGSGQPAQRMSAPPSPSQRESQATRGVP